MTTLSNKSGIRTEPESVLFSWEHTTHVAVRPGKLWQKVAENTSSQELVLYNALQQGLHLCLTEWLCWAETSFWLSEECGHPYAPRNKQNRKGERRSSSYRKIFYHMGKNFFHVYSSTIVPTSWRNARHCVTIIILTERNESARWQWNRSCLFK